MQMRKFRELVHMGEALFCNSHNFVCVDHLGGQDSLPPLLIFFISRMNGLLLLLHHVELSEKESVSSMASAKLTSPSIGISSTTRRLYARKLFVAS